jgi:Caspase domain
MLMLKLIQAKLPILLQVLGVDMLCIVALCFTSPAAAAICADGPARGTVINNEQLCSAFVIYRDDDTLVDPRISKYIYGDQKEKRRSHSFALVVGVGRYSSQLESPDLDAAIQDADNFARFLANSQAFDIVVELKNENATDNNIRYFLQNFFLHEINRINFRTRFIFAFSGHGLPGTDAASRSNLLLWDATGRPDDPNTLSTETLNNSYLHEIKIKSFQTLVLINACFSGGYFNDIRSDPGGNPDNYDKKGAYTVIFHGIGTRLRG